MNDTPRRAPAAPVGKKSEAAPPAPPKQVREIADGRTPEVSVELKPIPEASDDAVERLARALCGLAGGRPDNHLHGLPEWEYYVQPAKEHLLAFRVIMEIEGAGEDDDNG